MAKIIVKDFGWERITHELRLMDNSFTKVGFPKNAQVGKPRKKVKGEKIATNMSEVAIIAAFNEFGTTAATSGRSGGSLLHIPARPFMSTSLDENLQELNQRTFKEYVRIVNGKSTVELSLARIGQFMVSKTKKKIRDLRTPPNALKTIQQKKSSNPLIDSGQMINSVTHVEVIK